MRARSLSVVLALVATLAACTSGGSPDPTTEPDPTTTTSEPDPLAGWTLEEKIGQIVMVGVDLTEPQPASISSVTDAHVGNVFLHGRSSSGTQAVLDLVHQLTDQPTAHDTRLFVGVDQEGGQVQTLTGPGFSTMPSALDQGAMSPADLQTAATSWGAELAAAGVNLNLAPVVDIPTEAGAAQNMPIGHYDRQYGYTLQDVGPHADAFANGMAASGVETSVKHFPGLGEVTGNTDTTANVTDTTTGPGSVQIDSFTHAIQRGTSMVMVSTAIYTQIDPSAPAAFSPVVVDQLLRKTLGFAGVVITDDLSAAEQVAAWSPGDRAVDAISAGCDIVLASKDPTVLPEMISALTAKAQADPAFADLVDAAVLRVLAAKS